MNKPSKALKKIMAKAEIGNMMDFYGNDARYDMDFDGSVACYVSVISNNLDNHFSKEEIRVIDKEEKCFRSLLRKAVKTEQEEQYE